MKRIGYSLYVETKLCRHKPEKWDKKSKKFQKRSQKISAILKYSLAINHLQ